LEAKGGDVAEAYGRRRWTRGRLACLSAISDALAEGLIDVMGAVAWCSRARTSPEMVGAVLVASGLESAMAMAMDWFVHRDGGASQPYPWFRWCDGYETPDRDDPNGLEYHSPQHWRGVPGPHTGGDPWERGTWADMARVACRSGRMEALSTVLIRAELSKGDFAACCAAACISGNVGMMRALLRDAESTSSPKGFNKRCLAAWTEAARAGSIAMLDALTSDAVSHRPMQAHDAGMPDEFRWLLGITHVDSRNRTGVLDWMERRARMLAREDGYGIAEEERMDAMHHLVPLVMACGDVRALAWLVERAGPTGAWTAVSTATESAFDHCLPAGPFLDAAVWLMTRESPGDADAAVERPVSAAIKDEDLMYSHVIHLMERYPLITARHITPDLVESMLRNAIRMGKWRLIDRIVTVVHALHGVAHQWNSSIDLWPLLIYEYARAARDASAPRPGYAIERMCRTAAAMCAMARRSRLLAGWTDEEEADHRSPRAADVVCKHAYMPTVPSIPIDAWRAWCRPAPLDRRWFKQKKKWRTNDQKPEGGSSKQQNHNDLAVMADLLGANDLVV
jgi:hypothetical protein